MTAGKLRALLKSAFSHDTVVPRGSGITVAATVDWADFRTGCLSGRSPVLAIGTMRILFRILYYTKRMGRFNGITPG